MEITGQAASRHDREVAEFLERLVDELQPLQRRYNEALWRASVTGDEAHVEESARLDARIRKIGARREPFEFMRRVVETDGVRESGLRRQLVVTLDQFRPNQIPPDTIERMVGLEKGLENTFHNFRAELDGERVSDNAIRQVLRASEDPGERRRAWEASKRIGREVVDRLLDLVRLRNGAARDLGFDNHYSMMLALDELDEGELFALLDDLESGTRRPFATYKQDLDSRLCRRFGVTAGELRPWHLSDPFFQEAPVGALDLDRAFRDRSLPELAERYFRSIGFDVREVLERSDLYEKRGKSQHAFCISVDRGRDVRVLCNLRPNEFWMSTLLHELGHAVYDRNLDPALPYLLRVPAHTLTTEASAMLFGRLSKNAAWLRRYAGLRDEEASAAAAEAGRRVRAQLLVQTRWCLVMCHMERELYRRPDRDLNSVWWDLVERFQDVRRPDDRDEPDWAAKIHFSVAPVYYHNYLLGEITASQLQARLQEVAQGAGDVWERYVTSPEVGAHLTERLYRLGKSVDWREAVRGATGQPLSASAFVEELAGET